MIIKYLEIRDEGTCIPAVALKMVPHDPVEDKFLWRCGYPRDGTSVVLMRLRDQGASCDPFEWAGGRTMNPAHRYIIENFDELVNGQVVDVRVILGEAAEPAEPDIFTGPNLDLAESPAAE